MKRWLASVAVVVVAAALLAVAVRPGPPIEITYNYSTDADEMLEPLVEEFNHDPPLVRGHPIHVTVQPVSSGTEMLDLVAGAVRPSAWTPASQVWGGQLGERTNSDPPSRSGSLVSTPEVLAIWCSEAARRGWVDLDAWTQTGECKRVREPSWAEVLDLARQGSPRDPDSFLLGQTNPEASTSGVFALASQYLAVIGAPLTPPTVANEANRAAVRDVQRSLIHYGATSREVKDKLCDLGQAYVSGLYLQEATVLELNAQNDEPDAGCQWGNEDRLMAFYPSGGTFVADYPFYVLAEAGSLEAEAAQKLWKWLSERTEAGDPDLAASHFRARTGELPVTGTPEDSARAGPKAVVDPEQPSVPVLDLPSPAALKIAQDNWKADRNPARVALVVDISGPMRTGGQLDAMKDGLHKLVDELRLGDSVSDRDRDQLSLTTFSATVQAPLLDMGVHTQQEIDNAIDAIALHNDGGTALFDGVWAGFEPFRSLTYDDDTVINALIVVSSGVSDAGKLKDASSLLTPTRMLPNLASRPLTRVFTVFPNVPDDDPTNATGGLAEIADKTYGKSFTGEPDGILAAFETLPNYF